MAARVIGRHAAVVRINLKVTQGNLTLGPFRTMLAQHEATVAAVRRLGSRTIQILATAGRLSTGSSAVTDTSWTLYAHDGDRTHEPEELLWMNDGYLVADLCADQGGACYNFICRVRVSTGDGYGRGGKGGYEEGSSGSSGRDGGGGRAGGGIGMRGITHADTNLQGGSYGRQPPGGMHGRSFQGGTVGSAFHSYGGRGAAPPSFQPRPAAHQQHFAAVTQSSRQTRQPFGRPQEGGPARRPARQGTTPSLLWTKPEVGQVSGDYRSGWSHCEASPGGRRVSPSLPWSEQVGQVQPCRNDRSAQSNREAPRGGGNGVSLQQGQHMTLDRLRTLIRAYERAATAKLRVADTVSHPWCLWSCATVVRHRKATRKAARNTLAAAAAAESAKSAARGVDSDPMIVLAAEAKVKQAEQEADKLASEAPRCEAMIKAKKYAKDPVTGAVHVSIERLNLNHTCGKDEGMRIGMPRRIHWEAFARSGSAFYMDCLCSAVSDVLKGMIAEHVKKVYQLPCTRVHVTPDHVAYARQALKLFVNGPQRSFGFLPHLGERVMDADVHSVFQLSVSTVHHKSLAFILAEDGESVGSERGPCRARQLQGSTAARRKTQERVLQMVKREVDTNRGADWLRCGVYQGLQRDLARQAWEINHAKQVHLIEAEALKRGAPAGAPRVGTATATAVHAGAPGAVAVQAVPAASVGTSALAAAACHARPNEGAAPASATSDPAHFATAVPAVPTAAAPAAEEKHKHADAGDGLASGAARSKAKHRPANDRGFPTKSTPVPVLHCDGVFYLVGKGMRALLSRCIQPHLLVDYCHCKCGGGLYCVVAQDGNNQMLPIAVLWLPNFEVSGLPTLVYTRVCMLGVWGRPHLPDAAAAALARRCVLLLPIRTRLGGKSSESG